MTIRQDGRGTSYSLADGEAGFQASATSAARTRPPPDTLYILWFVPCLSGYLTFYQSNGIGTLLNRISRVLPRMSPMARTTAPAAWVLRISHRTPPPTTRTRL